MVLSTYAKQRVIALYSEGFTALTIVKKLREAIYVTQVGTHKFLCVYKATHTVNRRSGSGRPSKITAEIRKLVDQQMIKDNKTATYHLHQLLLRNQQYFVDNYSPVPNRVGMAISRLCLLPNHPRCQQREEIKVGS